jgi:hypothetical protein
MPMFNKEKMKIFWDLWKDLSVSEEDSANLYLTFDRCVVKKEDFDKVIINLKEFDKTINQKNHFSNIPIELEKLKTTDIIGVGFIWTSVAGDIWDREDGNKEVLNLLKEKEDFFYLFDEHFLNGRKKTST